MSRYYTAELSEESLLKLIMKYKDISRILKSADFKEYLLKKCIEKRDYIMQERNIEQIENESNGANQEKVNAYINSNKTEISGNVIKLYNDAYFTNTQLTHFFNEDNRDENYDGLSIAELVEYGSGLAGASSSLNTGTEWDYMSNYKGWVYKGDDGEKVFTNGREGKYIYYFLSKAIEDNIEQWTNEYLEKKLGSGL